MATAGAIVEAETELFGAGVEEDVVAAAAMMLERVAREVEALPSDWVTIEVTMLTETLEDEPMVPPLFVLTGEGDTRVVVESSSEDRGLETVKTLAAGSVMPDGPTTNRVGLDEEDEEEAEGEEVVVEVEEDWAAGEEDWAAGDTA